MRRTEGRYAEGRFAEGRFAEGQRLALDYAQTERAGEPTLSTVLTRAGLHRSRRARPMCVVHNGTEIRSRPSESLNTPARNPFRDWPQSCG